MTMAPIGRTAESILRTASSPLARMSSSTRVTVATTCGSLLWGVPTSAVGAFSVTDTIRISLRCTAGLRASNVAGVDRCRRDSSLGGHRLPRQTHHVQQARDLMHTFTVVGETLVDCQGPPWQESVEPHVRLRELPPSSFGWRSRRRPVRPQSPAFQGVLQGEVQVVDGAVPSGQDHGVDVDDGGRRPVR